MFVLKGIKGNSTAIGLTDGTIFFGIAKSHPNGVRYINGELNLYGTIVGTTGIDDNTNSNKSIGLTTDSTKSGIESEINSNINYCIKY